ncbi:hypothetical protein GIV96_01970 [Pseudomonas syringae]|nr:hypothetical protein [Pseudomonas syringae]MCF5414358.1 hypothetical protein [Pseudomonas syringae]MCF5465837.1 hypothetical protein [Pseudomonas syringae]
MQTVDAQRHLQQAGRRPGKIDGLNLDAVCALLPHEAFGAPLAAQSSLKVFQLHTGHPSQGPLAARMGAQQQRDTDDHQQQ